MEYSEYQHLVIERKEDGILLITINRPEVLNATNKRLHWELSRVWLDIADDPATRVVVVTGAGRAFSAGGDLDMIDGMAGNAGNIAQAWKEAGDIVYNMINCDKPIISAINGVAVGAGLAVAFMADISIASEAMRITDGHLRLGVAAGDHAVIVWPLLCGMAKAKYSLMTADFIDGREAERIEPPADRVRPGAEGHRVQPRLRLLADVGLVPRAVKQPAQQAVVLVAHLAHAAHDAGERHPDPDQGVRSEHQPRFEGLGHHLGGARGRQLLDVALLACAHDHGHGRIEGVDVRQHPHRRSRAGDRGLYHPSRRGDGRERRALPPGAHGRFAGPGRGRREDALVLRRGRRPPALSIDRAHPRLARRAPGGADRQGQGCGPGSPRQIAYGDGARRSGAAEPS